MNSRLIFITFSLTVVLHPSMAQSFSEKDLIQYTKSEGLSNKIITGIAQDAAGYLWLSSNSGINRYDGTQFVEYNSNTDSSSPGAEFVNGMTCLDKNRLAFYSAGLNIVDTRTGKSYNLLIPWHNKQYQYKFNMIECVKSDKAGNIIVLTRSGLYHYDNNYRLLLRFDYYTAAETLVEHFSFAGKMMELDDERLLIISIGGLYIYNIKEQAIKKMQAADCPLLAEFLTYPKKKFEFLQKQPGQFFIFKLNSDSLVYVDLKKKQKTISRLPFNPIRDEFHYRSKLFAITDSVIYITGHNSGYFKMLFDPASGRVQLLTHRFFPDYLINYIFVDAYKNVWIATNKGLLRFDPGKSQVLQTSLPPGLNQQFPNVSFFNFYTSTDTIYASALGMGGLLLFDKKTLQFTRCINIDKFANSGNRSLIIYNITPVNRSRLLLGLNGPLLSYDLARKTTARLNPPGWDIDHYWSADTYKDSRGIIWISAHEVYRYYPASNTFKSIPNQQLVACGLNIPSNIREDADGNIWMAGHGLARFNVQADSFDLVLDSFPYIRMADKQVGAMVIDRLQNTIWFSSNYNGLISYDIKTGKYRHFNMANGLPGNNITSLIVVDRKLWLACSSGIACLDLQTEQITRFGKEDGFPDLPIRSGTRFYYDSTDRQLYLGISQMMVRFNPYTIVHKRPSPRIFIEDLVIRGQHHVLPGNRLTTSWQNNDVTIIIGNINFYNTEGQCFAYRIVNNQYTWWQRLGHQPSFSISNLPPGENRIQVRSYSLYNRWPNQFTEIVILVQPPFWERTWFIITAVVLVLMAGYLLVNWRIRLVRKKEMEKTNMQKLKADHYKNQYELEQISNYFSSSIANKTDSHEVLWDVAQNLIARLNYEDCIIYCWNDDKTKMIQKAAYGPKGTPEALNRQVFDVLPGQGIVGYVMQTREPLLVPDTRKDTRYRVDDMVRMSEICVPIIHNDELIGIIDSEHHELNYFKERDLKILTTIATLIGNKVKQIESEQSLQAKQVELATLNGQLAEARLSALQAQMNPHFIFNALNSIKRMILDGDDEKSSTYLSKFALMIRLTLSHSKDAFVTLSETIAYLETYLDMEQLRFDDSFTWHIEVDDSIDTEDTLIPSLMLQPIAENAIWHGLMQVEGDKKINIGFAHEQNKIICTIEDNGIGIRKAGALKAEHRTTYHSVGLDNLRNRIKIMNEKFNTGCSLHITDLQDTGNHKRGTLVTLRLNVINSYS
jgi:two-component system LytT family sensor kinase